MSAHTSIHHAENRVYNKSARTYFGNECARLSTPSHRENSGLYREKTQEPTRITRRGIFVKALERDRFISFSLFRPRECVWVCVCVYARLSRRVEEKNEGSLYDASRKQW